MIDWKAEISRAVYWKQLIAEKDQHHAYPWHLPRVAATSEEIAGAENSTEFSFPSEYIEFLYVANGWQAFVINIDLFGTKDFIDGRSTEIKQRSELAELISEYGLGADELVVIGASNTDLDVFLYVSTKSKLLPGGVLWLANEEVDRYKSFADFFSAMVNYNARVAHRLAAGAPPSPKA